MLQTQKTLRYYKLSYIIALTIIAVVTMVSQVMIQRHLSSQQSDSHLINYAARLRTNSQSVIKLGLLIVNDRDIAQKKEFKTYRKDFKTILMQWKRTHESLLYGNEFLGLPENKNEEMKELFEIIDNPYKAIMAAGDKAVDILFDEKGFDYEAFSNQMNEILTFEKAYFLGMEMIVFDYDRNSRKNITRLQKIELYLMLMVLSMLLIEAIFIFRPLSVRIASAFNALIQAKGKNEKRAKELQIANERLESNHKELREITYALEKATFMVKVDAKGQIIYANDKYCHITRYSLKDLIGKPLFYNSNINEKSIIYDHINNPENNREVWQGEVYDNASDGSDFWLDVTLMPVFDKLNNVYQYLMIGVDITPRKLTENKVKILLEEKIKRQEDIQKVRSTSLVAGQDKERKRVAAEIHDGIGQMLTSLRMRVEMLNGEEVPAQSQITEIHELIRGIITETRRIIAELRPNVLDDFGLEPAIKDLVGKVQIDSNIDIVSDINLSMNNYGNDVELGIYRILQEVLNNSVKHAKASQVVIVLEGDQKHISLEVSDDGVGFELNNQSIFDTPLGLNSHGLTNMKERALSIGGELKIYTNPGKGTSIKLDIPLS